MSSTSGLAVTASLIGCMACTVPAYAKETDLLGESKITPISLAVQLDAAQAAPVASPGAATGREETTIDDIVVTARRKDEQLQEVPVAITALSGEQLEARGILKASDLTASVPGTFSAPGGSRGSNSPIFGIRGQLNRDPTASNDPSIGLYFAEVPWSRVQGSNAAFLDLQSVEVLKGPQGTLFGRNTTGGAILITPHAPTDVVEGYAKLTGGSYDLFGYEAVANLPASDTVAMRLATSHEQRRGFLIAVNSGQRLNDVDNYSVRASAKWTPSDDFSSTTIASFYTSNTNSDGMRLIGVAPRSPSAGLAGLYPRFVDALARTNQLGKYEFFTQFSPDVANVEILGAPSVYTTEQYARVRTWSVQNSSLLELGESPIFGDLKLKNIIAYREVKEAVSSDTVATDFLNIAATFSMNMKQFSEELQLQGTSGDVDYIVGIFYSRETGYDRSKNYSVVPRPSLVDNVVTNTSYSAFANINYDLSSVVAPGLGISAGIRFNNDKRFWNGMNRNQTSFGETASPQYTCPLQPTVPVNDGSLCNRPVSTSFHVPTWNIAVSYKAAPGSLLYGTVSRGYRAGGYSLSAANPAAAEPFLEENVLNYEIGSKNDFNLGTTDIRLNLAAFYTDYSDIQRTVNIAGGTSNRTINAAKAHILGGEVDLSVKPTRDLLLSLAYSYIRPKYDSFTDFYTETDPAFLPPGVTGVVYPVDVSDSDFILVSRHSLSASLSYTVPIDERRGTLSLNANYYYRSSFLTTSDINTANCQIVGNPNPAAIYTNCYNRAGRLPGYALLNFRADWRDVMGQGFDLSVFVNNVTDKYYYNNALNVLGSVGAISAQVGAPRMAGVTLTLPFGG